MQIVVVSDTHVQSYDKLPKLARSAVESADAVIHAGDFITEECCDGFAAAARAFYPVRGNNDFFDIPEQQTITLDEMKIAVIHGHQVRGAWENWLSYRFANFQPEIIIFGHTHTPYLQSSGGITMLNPGSVTRRRITPYHSYAVIDTTTKDIKIVPID